MMPSACTLRRHALGLVQQGVASSRAAAGAAGRCRSAQTRLLLLAGRPFSSAGSGSGSGSGEDKEQQEERRPHVWGEIPTGPAGGLTTAVGGGGRQFFVTDPEEDAARAAAEAAETDPVDFLAESGAFLERVERGLADMKAVNDPFGITRDDVELVVDLGPAKGKFTLQRDWTQNQLVLLSPVSGIYKYQCHGKKGERRWLSVTEDRHDLVGMLTRDLIRVCAGCPQI